MWSVESNLYADPLGLSLPQDKRLPWNPWSSPTFQSAVNESRQLWNTWTSAVFPDIESYENRQLWKPWSETESNENRQLWKPWSETAHQEAKKNGKQNSSQLFPDFQDSSTVVGNHLNRTESKSESFVSDEAMILQNISNDEKLHKSYQNSAMHKDFYPRKKNRKNRRRNRQLITGVNNANSSHGLKQHEHEKWNHQPVINWSKRNPPSGPLETDFQNPFRSTTFNKPGKKTRVVRNSTRDKLTNDASNFSGSQVRTRRAVARDNFELRNLSDYSKNHKGNIVPPSSNYLNNRKKLTIMENKWRPIPITSSANSKNIADIHESSNEDITYLFSVDCTSEANMVLEVDLSSNEINLIPNKNSNKADNLNKEKDAKDYKSTTVSVEKEVIVLDPPRKRKLSINNDISSKRPDYQPECTACNMRYNDVISKGGTMHISSSCSHILCHPCVSKDKNAKICPACGVKLILLRKLYL